MGALGAGGAWRSRGSALCDARSRSSCCSCHSSAPRVTLRPSRRASSIGRSSNWRNWLPRAGEASAREDESLSESHPPIPRAILRQRPASFRQRALLAPASQKRSASGWCRRGIPWQTRHPLAVQKRHPLAEEGLLLANAPRPPPPRSLAPPAGSMATACLRVATLTPPSTCSSPRGTSQRAMRCAADDTLLFCLIFICRLTFRLIRASNAPGPRMCRAEPAHAPPRRHRIVG